MQLRVRITGEQERAFLDRLGVEREPPSVSALRQLHRRLVERVPYETLWLHAGEGWGVDPVESVERIAMQGRGGYCFHLNGAFAELLVSLGYSVTRHVGAVYGPDGPGPAEKGNHVVLSVSGLPSDENPSGNWYLDAGLGDALYEPLPLCAGQYAQGPFRLGLADDGDGGWRLLHDPAGGFVGMRWTTPGVELDWFRSKHEWLATAADSPFAQVAMAERRDPTGVDVMRGLVLSRIGDGAVSLEPLTDRRAWFDALADVFDLRFDHTAPGVRDQLWAKVLKAHHVWEAAQ